MHRGSFVAGLFVWVVGAVSGAWASPAGLWSDSDSPVSINGNRPVFGERWYVIPSGPSVCALRANYINSALSHIRLYRGTLDGGHMVLYKGPVILGMYADEPELVQFVPSDPYHFFVGQTALILRLQLLGERANRFIVLQRQGDAPQDLEGLRAAKGCNVP